MNRLFSIFFFAVFERKSIFWSNYFLCEHEMNGILKSLHNYNFTIFSRLNVDVQLCFTWIIIFTLQNVSCSSLTTRSHFHHIYSMKCLREWKWLYLLRAFDIFVYCVSAVLHFVINGSRRACKTNDNNGLTQKSEHLFYATNSLVLITLFRNCMSYLWQTKIRNKLNQMKMKWRKNETPASTFKDFQKDIAKYRTHFKWSWHFLFHLTL